MASLWSVIEVLTAIKEEAHQVLAGRIDNVTSQNRQCTLDRDWAVFKGYFGSIRLLGLLYMVAQLQRVPFMSVSM